MKNVKMKNDKTSAKEEQQDDKVGTVDQIKKKYGFSSSTSNVSISHLLPSSSFLI